MQSGKKSTAAIPYWAAALSALVLFIICVSSVLTGGPVPATGSLYSPGSAAAGPASSLPTTCQPDFMQAPALPVTPEIEAFGTLDLALPPAEDRVPYTERGFEEPVEAAIAWWMSPGFMDNTSEFRRYERTAADGRPAYPEEHRIFFAFIEDELDSAGQHSVLTSDRVLFRGIGPSFAGTVMNTSRYSEPAFASTSYDISVTLEGFGSRGPDGYRNVMVLEREAGDHALYVNEDQREYLLPRGTEWTVSRITSFENLTVTADFTLHNQTTGTATFDHVRLIFLEPVVCL